MRHSQAYAAAPLRERLPGSGVLPDLSGVWTPYVEPGAPAFGLPREHTAFYRAGWRPNMISVGDHITVEFAPRRNAADGGFINGFTTASGVTVAFKVPTTNPVADRGG